MRHVSAVAVALFVLAAGAVSAATFAPVSDAALVENAQLVVRGTVLDSASRLRADGVIVTDSRIAVEDVLKGRAGAEVVVTEVGGSANGILMVIPGSPEYVRGSRVLAFLKQRDDGTWFTSNMGLGHFRFERGADGDEVLARADTGLEVDDAAAFQPRRAEAFQSFVRNAARGVVVSAAPIVTNAVPLVPRADLAPADYVFKSGSPQRPLRWEGCDQGCQIGFFYNGDQPGVIDSGTNVGIDKAMDAWTDDPNSFVQIGLGGQSNVTNVAQFDQENTIVLNNSTAQTPNVGYCDGALGCGIVWAVEGANEITHQFRNTTFRSVLFADVVIRPGTHSQSFFEALVAHELGHALALEHSPSTGALMSSTIPSNATASLKSYDRTAMAEVYGEGAAPPPCTGPTITGTSGGGTWPYGSNKQLSVTVSGTSPFSYKWYRGQSGDTSAPVATTEKYTVQNITGTEHYWVRVTSQCNTQLSADSATITVNAEPCTLPAITSQPQSQQITPGSTATLSISATGTNLNYRWYEATTVGDTSKIVANTAQFTTPPLSATTSYWVKVSNACNETGVFSQLATITVRQPNQCIPATIVGHPAGAAVALGNGITLHVTAAGDAPFTYQWFHGDSGDESQPIAGATTASYAISSFTTPGTYKYWVRVANACPQSTPARSNTAIVTVACGDVATPRIAAPSIAHFASGYNVEWSGNLALATSFELQEATNPEFTQGLRVYQISGALTHRIDPRPSLTANTRFYYRVRAFSSCTQQPTAYSRTASTVVTAPLPATSREFSISVPHTATESFTQSYLVPGFGAQATAGDLFAISSDAPWLTVTPSSGALPAGGTTVQFTIFPASLGVGSSTASVRVTRTQGSGKGGVATHATSSSSLPFSVSKVTPVTPAPRDAEPPAGTLIIPAVAHADGIGTRFQSDVRIANTTAQELMYELSFTPSASNGTATGKKTTMTIAARETKGLDDVVKAWYGAGLLGEAGLGTLEIRPMSPLPPFSTFAASRTYAVTEKGTLGQFIPALGLDKFVGDISADSLAKISLQQIANSATYRTNFGFVEGSGQAATIVVRLLDANNNLLKEVERTLQPYGHEQMGLPALFGNIPLDDGRVEMHVKSAGGKATAYASVVDNKTSDPLLVFPTQAARVSSQTYVVPGVAEVDNGPASNFHTDMRIFNASFAPVDVTLNYYPQAGDPTPRPNPVTLRIDPLQVKAIDNVLPSLWNMSRTGGAVTVTTPTAAPLVLTARTFSREADNGTYGQFIPGVTAGDATGLGERGLELLQLEHSETYRTNVGLVEVTGKPVIVEVLAESPQSKSSAVAHFELQGSEFRQMGIFRQLGFPNTVYNGRVTVRVVAGEGRVAAYGSVIDNRTVDPTYVPAQ